MLSMFGNISPATWFSLAMACATSLTALLLLTPVARAVGLVDTPNSRKLHEGAVPLIGGITIFISSIVYLLFFAPQVHDKILVLFATASLLFLSGLMDDFKPLSWRMRLVTQVFAAGSMIYFTDIKIESLGDLFGFGLIETGMLSVPLTILAVVGITNAFNLCDGIDGLAGSLALVAIAAIIAFQSSGGGNPDLDFLLAIGAATVPYLLFNIFGNQNRKVFLGDAGSLFIGYVICFTLIHQTQRADATIQPASALWVVAIPLVDTIGVMVRRVRKGQSPFQPDRNHLHHILMRAGFSPKGALVLLTGSASSLVLLGLAIEGSAPQWSFPAFFLVFIGYYWLLTHAWRVQRLLKH